VIVTRQGKGSVVSDNAELGKSLRYRELDEHLTAAADIARQLGLPADELQARLREMAKSGGEQ
jgi:hypothetical protein